MAAGLNLITQLLVIMYLTLIQYTYTSCLYMYTVLLCTHALMYTAHASVSLCQDIQMLLKPFNRAELETFSL